MSGQLDLFFVAPRLPWRMEDGYPGWQARFLREMAATGGSTVAPFPGFTGAMHEALVERGHATREDAGFMPDPVYVEGCLLGDKRATPKSFARWVASLEPRPQYRYTITAAGRAALEEQDG